MPYHKYVFDENKREFVGKFEEMYQGEDKEGYDSWYQQNLNHLPTQVSLTLLNQYNFSKILDIGCGKGAVTHLLKRTNNKVRGIDISKTAIEKAKARYKDIDFKVLSVNELIETQQEQYDLVVMIESLSYMENWREVIKYTSSITRYIFIRLYLPNNPIGFVKSFKSLKDEIVKYFDIEVENLLNNEALFILGVKRKPLPQEDERGR